MWITLSNSICTRLIQYTQEVTKTETRETKDNDASITHPWHKTDLVTTRITQPKEQWLNKRATEAIH